MAASCCVFNPEAMLAELSKDMQRRSSWSASLEKSKLRIACFRQRDQVDLFGSSRNVYSTAVSFLIRGRAP